MKIEDQPSDFLYVVHAEQTDGALRKGVALLNDGVCSNNDVARASGALAVVDGNDVGGSAGANATRAAIGDDENALVGDRIDGFQTLAVGEERSKNNSRANEQKRQSEKRKKGKNA